MSLGRTTRANRKREGALAAQTATAIATVLLWRDLVRLDRWVLRAMFGHERHAKPFAES